jgi:hypothetical protein
MDMESLAHHNDKKPVINRGLLVGIIVGLVLVAAFVGVLMLRPSMADQKAAVLADAIRPGHPEFEQLANDILINTGDDTVESPNAFGHISMYIAAQVRNKGTRTFNGLELNVAVIDQQSQVVRDKTVLVVPTQRPELGPDETIRVTLEISGFQPKDDRANIRWTVTGIRLAS